MQNQLFRYFSTHISYMHALECMMISWADMSKVRKEKTYELRWSVIQVIILFWLSSCSECVSAHTPPGLGNGGSDPHDTLDHQYSSLRWCHQKVVEAFLHQRHWKSSADCAEFSAGHSLAQIRILLHLQPEPTSNNTASKYLLWFCITRVSVYTLAQSYSFCCTSPTAEVTNSGVEPNLLQ